MNENKGEKQFQTSNMLSSIPKNTDFTVLSVPILDSNYVWILRLNNSPKVIVIDPGRAEPIINFLENQDLRVEAIFITHSHHDHIGGLDDFLIQYPAPVYGPECQRIPQVTHIARDNARISIGGFGEFSIMHLPGHLPEHIAYVQYARDENDEVSPTAVFSGDILFSSGCGRIFDGSAQELHRSLMRLSNLPSHVLVYASHEYTTQNIEFALTIEPENSALKSKATQSINLRKHGQSTLPTRIGIENQTNPFLRCSHNSVKTSVEDHSNKLLPKDVDVFAELRKMKDVF